MQPIPPKLKKQIDKDSFYRKCCIADYQCGGRIEMHHNLIYSGRQQNYLFAILPVCNYHHGKEKSSENRDRLDWIMLQRTTLEFLTKTFPKRNWIVLQNYLHKKYATN